MNLPATSERTRAAAAAFRLPRARETSTAPPLPPPSSASRTLMTVADSVSPTKRTASALNSGVKLRRFRGGLEGLVGLMDTSFIMTELKGSGGVHESGG